jgi:signal transduction histidine kinase
LETFLDQNIGPRAEFINFQVLPVAETGEKSEQIRNKTKFAEKPIVIFKADKNWILAATPLDEFQELLQVNVKEIQNIAYFLISGKKIVSNSISSFDFKEIEQIKSRIAADDISQESVLIGDKEFLFTSSWLMGQDVMLVTRINAMDFYAELRDFRNKILVANIVFATILIALAIVSSRRITTPLHKLINATQDIGRGNLDKKIELTTNDEIQILANEFELMRRKLQESYQGLEEKIQKRTRELQEAQAQISHQEKMASLGMMAAGIAHEIGNPLTSISSMVQIIKRKNDDPKTNEYVTNILKNIDRISRIVRELVDFSRPSSYEKAPADINEIIKSAVGIMRYDRRSKNLNYQLSLDPDLPKTILVSDHILQVFLNVLINAVDSCEGYGNKISVKSFSRNGNIWVNIIDQGCGIPEELRNKIFEPFYTTKEVGRGTGLGLTVSYGFIKKLNGEIKVKSKLGKGSTFSVIIPVVSHIEE